MSQQASVTQVATRTKWIGPYYDEAQAAFDLARGAKMNALRSRVWGHIGSHKICWAFRREIAKAEDCSIRTVQRAITEGQEKGIGRAVRSKPDDLVPTKGGKLKPAPSCGCSIRWVAGWGKALAKRLEEIAKNRARRLLQRATPAAVVTAATVASAQAIKRPSSFDVERDARGHVTVTRAPVPAAAFLAMDRDERATWLDEQLDRRPRDGPK